MEYHIKNGYPDTRAVHNLLKQTNAIRQLCSMHTNRLFIEVNRAPAKKLLDVSIICLSVTSELKVIAFPCNETFVCPTQELQYLITDSKNNYGLKNGHMNQ